MFREGYQEPLYSNSSFLHILQSRWNVGRNSACEMTSHFGQWSGTINSHLTEIDCRHFRRNGWFPHGDGHRRAPQAIFVHGGAMQTQAILCALANEEKTATAWLLANRHAFLGRIQSYNLDGDKWCITCAIFGSRVEEDSCSI